MQVRTTNLHLIYVINRIKNLSCRARLTSTKINKGEYYAKQL
nr:MAG TPA: hypothetical protein [Caudoviricetes sp.]